MKRTYTLVVLCILLIIGAILVIYSFIKRDNTSTIADNTIVATRGTPAETIFGSDVFVKFDYIYPEDWPDVVKLPDGCYVPEVGKWRHPDSPTNEMAKNVFVNYCVLDASPEVLYKHFVNMIKGVNASISENESGYHITYSIFSKGEYYIVRIRVRKDPYWPGKACSDISIINVDPENGIGKDIIENSKWDKID